MSDHGDHEVAPFAAPPWITPARVAVAACVLGSAASALPAVALLDPAREEMREPSAAGLVATAIAAVLALTVASAAAATRSAAASAIVCVLGGMAAGIANGGLTLFGVSAARGDPALATLPLGMLFGAPFGAAYGLAFGTAFALLVPPAVRRARAPTHEDVDATLARAGAWLIPTTALAAWIDTAARNATVELAAAAIGTVSLVTGALRFAQRRAWLRRVREARVEGWSVVPRGEAAEDAPLLPFTRERCCAHVLARVSGPASPYRAARDLRAIALLA